MPASGPRPRPAAWLALLGLGTLLAACTPPPAAPPVVPAVFVTPVRHDTGAVQRVLSGSVRPRVEAQLSFRTGGKVTARLVETGQAVRAGQVLARLDPADHALAVQAAEAQQRAAEVDAAQAARDAARFKRLLAEGSVGAADAERQQARADATAARLAEARQQAELARNRAGYAALTAPFDGVVTALRFEVGQLVDDRQPVLGLARPGELEVQVDVPEALVAGLRGWQASLLTAMPTAAHTAVPTGVPPAVPTAVPGGDGTAPVQAAGAGAGAGSGQAVPLRLRELEPTAHPVTRTTRARYAPVSAAQAAGWRIGMTAELRLQRPGREPGAELPLGALLVTQAAERSAATSGTYPTPATPKSPAASAPASTSAPASASATASAAAAPGGPTVWLVNPQTGALTRQPVRLLSQTTDTVRVAGLAEGALVVSVGAHKLDAGMTVRPVPRPLAAAPLAGVR